MTDDKKEELEENGENEEYEEDDEDDELLNEIESVIEEMRLDKDNRADYAKVLVMMYCGRSLSIIAKVLYQRMQP